MREFVCRNPICRARKLCHLKDEQTNRSTAKYPDRHPGFELAQINAMDSDAERLQHGAIGIRQRSGNGK
jgi:hypothetical protein